MIVKLWFCYSLFALINITIQCFSHILCDSIIGGFHVEVVVLIFAVGGKRGRSLKACNFGKVISIIGLKIIFCVDFLSDN